MDEDVTFHPPTLRRSGQGLADVADRLLREWQGLLNDVRGMGDVFGDDMIGGLIGASYAAVQDAAEESYDSAVEHLHGMGSRLAEMAEVYEVTEQASRQDFGQIRDLF